MNAVVTLDLIKGEKLAAPRFSTPGPVTRHLDGTGYEAFTGIGPDLMQAARGAVSSAIDWLCREHRMPAEQAYMLCSVCGDLRISEIVESALQTATSSLAGSIIGEVKGAIVDEVKSAV